MSGPFGMELFVGESYGFSDGPRTRAMFEEIWDLEADALGNIFVLDFDKIRKIAPDGYVTTVNPTGPDALEGFFIPQGICLATNGDIYVADAGCRIIKLSPASCQPSNAGSDTDGDGIPDWAECAHTPYIAGIDDRMVDSDGDGQSNSAEYVAGTDPSDPHSVFKVQINQTPEGEVVLRWETSLNRAYQLQYSDDFEQWTNLGGCPAAYGRMQIFTTSRSTNSRFYRVLVKQF